MIDNRTENKNYPLPHPQNIASQDVGRIATAIEMIDGDVNAWRQPSKEFKKRYRNLTQNRCGFLLLWLEP
jgi:hypothetical protein